MEEDIIVKVVFYSVPLSVDINVIEEALLDDPILHEAVKIYSEELRMQNIETFKIIKNMIVTETGYKIAIRQELANLIESN